MFEQKINPENFFLRDICYLRDTAKAFLHETSASNNKAFDGHSAIQLLANDRFMDRSLGGRSANFAQDPLTCHRPAMSAHLHHCSRAVRQVTAKSGCRRTSGFALYMDISRPERFPRKQPCVDGWSVAEPINRPEIDTKRWVALHPSSARCAECWRVEDDHCGFADSAAGAISQVA